MGDLNQEKGTHNKVEPIESLKDIEAIKEILAGNPRNFALFTVGINTPLKAEELVEIEAGRVKNLKEGETFEVQVESARTPREVTLNRDCIQAIGALLEAEKPADGDKLFLSQRGGGLSANSVDRMVGDWCEAINLSGNYGGDSLRKTWEFHRDA